jgi:hypothetical protein
MTAILRDLPFLHVEDEVAVGLERVRVKPYQIVVWVSLTARNVLELPPHAPRVPAILDTGHNHYFSIQARHLTRWARTEEAGLPPRDRIRERGRHPPLRAANVWIHPNRCGERDAFSDDRPFLVPLEQGIAIYPGESDYPRLPLLGLRTLVQNKLHFTMDPERCVVNLRTPDWRTRLLRWLV